MSYVDSGSGFVEVMLGVSGFRVQVESMLGVGCFIMTLENRKAWTHVAGVLGGP